MILIFYVQKKWKKTHVKYSSNDSTINACMRDYLPILVKWHWDFVVVNLISIDFHPLWEKDTKN